MSSSSSLLAKLGADRIPQVDLAMILQWSFTGASIYPEEPLAVVFGTRRTSA